MAEDQRSARALKRALAEVERRLREAAATVPKARAAERGRYMKPALPMRGLTVPEQRAVFRAGYSFSGLPARQQYGIWDYIWHNAGSHEAKLQPMLFLRSLPNIPAADDLEPFWALTRGWADDIHAWDMSDELSKTFSYLLEADRRRIYPQLVAWNTDRDPWKRRQSVVSLFCYAQLHRRHPPVTKVLPLIRRLLADQDYYVQKGVGWTLRETYNVYPERAHAFVLRHAGAIHPDAFSAALEKMSTAEKAAIKERRSHARRRRAPQRGRLRDASGEESAR